MIVGLDYDVRALARRVPPGAAPGDRCGRARSAPSACCSGMGATFEKTRFGAHVQERVAFAQASDHYSSEVLAALAATRAAPGRDKLRHVIHEGQPLAAARAVRRGRPRRLRAAARSRAQTRRTCSPLADRIGDPDVAFLAPAARDGTWYPESFLAPLAENEPWLSSALGVVEALLHVARRPLAGRARRLLAGRVPGGGVRAALSRGATAGCCSTRAGSSGRRGRSRRGWAPSRGRPRLPRHVSDPGRLGAGPSACARRRRR